MENYIILIGGVLAFVVPLAILAGIIESWPKRKHRPGCYKSSGGTLAVYGPCRGCSWREGCGK